MESSRSLNLDTQKYWLILKRRWLPATAVLGFTILLTTIYTLLQKPVYEARGRILIKNPNNVTSAIEENLGQEGKLAAVGKETDSVSTQVELINSISIAQKTIAALNLELKPKEFLENLRVKNVKGTDILEVAYQSPNPQGATAIVNQVMNLYLANNILVNKTDAGAARKFIVEQLPKNKANLQKAEASLRQFEEENKVVDLEAEAKSVVGAITELENQVRADRAKLADISSQSQTLRQKLGMNSQQAIAANALGQSPGVQTVLTDLRQVESQLAAGRAIYQETHPTIVNLKSKKSSLEALLQKRVKQVLGTQQQPPSGDLQKEELRQQIAADLVRLEAERLGLTNHISTLSNLLSTYKQRTITFPQLKQKQRDLEREVEVAQSTYETLLKRLEEIRVEENRNVGSARIVERALASEEPVAPRKSINLLAGNLLGLLLAIGTALLLEELDASIKTVKEVRQLFEYTLIGLIPTIPSFGKSEKTVFRRKKQEQNAPQNTPKIVVRDVPFSPISEQFRILKATLSFLCSEKELKIIVVTSSVPEEGKSTVSVNLAVAMAQAERKILLVDADMRQSTQHKIWDLPNESGLSNVLVGQAELTMAIKKVMVNLDLLAAGVTPPNPMNLIESKRMAALIENFSNQYDCVIIDTPAISIAADAAILGKMADGILLVARPGVVDTGSATYTKEFLKQSGQNVLGLVVNDVTSESKPNKYYGREYYIEENYDSEKNMSINKK